MNTKMENKIRNSENIAELFYGTSMLFYICLNGYIMLILCRLNYPKIDSPDTSLLEVLSCMTKYYCDSFYAILFFISSVLFAFETFVYLRHKKLIKTESIRVCT